MSTLPSPPSSRLVRHRVVQSSRAGRCQLLARGRIQNPRYFPICTDLRKSSIPCPLPVAPLVYITTPPIVVIASRFASLRALTPIPLLSSFLRVCPWLRVLVCSSQLHLLLPVLVYLPTIDSLLRIGFDFFRIVSVHERFPLFLRLSHYSHMGTSPYHPIPQSPV